MTSECNSFNDISDYLPLILTCKKASPNGFTRHLLVRKLKGLVEFVGIYMKQFSLIINSHIY